MKKSCLMAVAMIFAAKFCCAQWSGAPGNIYYNTGKVGIGTINPQVPLNILAYGNNVTGNMTLLSTFTDPTGVKGISLGYNQASQGGIIYSENNTGTGSPLEFWSYNGSSFAPRMVFSQAGNLGIGTTNPTALLHLVGGAVSMATTNGQYTLQAIDNSATSPLGGSALMGLYAGDMMLRSFWGVSVDLNDGLYGDNPSAAYTRIPATSSFTVNSRANATTFNTLFTVKSNGNVLIGKTSQVNTGYKLDVAGSVRANEVVVNTTGADFVFAPRYRLRPLTELKSYTAQYHHLPDVPSAREMQAGGLDLGANEVKLLQKVEELTLYLIDKDREIKNEKALNKAQSARLDAQQSQIDALRQQLNALLKKK
jgi:hypothetical protein